MAYYTALISAWNTGTVPAGVSGTPLTGLTTANKLVAINGWTITGTVPTSFYVNGAQVANCINWTEFNALTATQQQNLLALLAIPGSLLGGSANTSFLVDGMILAYFNVAGPTVAALTALAKGVVTPWWQVLVANGGGGLASPVNANDLAAAGGLT